MQNYLLALGFAVLPALGNLIGGLLAEALPTSKRALSLALHMATGVLLAVIALRLMPRVVEGQTAWVTILAFGGGGIVFVLADQLACCAEKRFGVREGDRGPWQIFLSLAINIFSGGLMIGTSTTLSRNLSLVLASARFVAHLPQGFTTIAEFKRSQVKRQLRLPILLSFFLPSLIGALVGYWLVRDRPITLGAVALVRPAVAQIGHFAGR